MDIPLHGKVGRTLEKAAGDEGVVHAYHQQGDDVENEEGGHGVNLRVQFPSVGVGGASNKALVCRGHIEGVQVRVHSLGDCQDEGEDPDECGSQENAGCGGRFLKIKGLHDGPVPD